MRATSTPDPFANQVEHLNDVQNQRNTGHHQHENNEDGFLCGSRHVALNSEGAGLSRTGEHGDHDEAVQIVLSHNEAGLNNYLDRKLGQIAPQ